MTLWLFTLYYTLNCSTPVVTKLVRTVTQIKAAILSYYPQQNYFRISGRKFLLQWSLIIPSNIVMLVPRYQSKNRTLPLRGSLPQF